MWGQVLGSAVSSLIGNATSKKTSVPGSITGSANVPPGNQNLPGVKEEPSMSEMIKSATKTSIAGAVGTKIGGLVNNKLNHPRHAGARAGRSQRAYMDAAYPGTTPWDRLHGSPSSAGSVGTADAQLKSNEKIAHINANAKITSAEIAARGIPATSAHRLEQAETERTQRGKIRAETKNIGLQSKRRTIENKYIDQMQKANLSFSQSRNILQQWRQATDGYMTPQNVSLVSAAASTIGAGAVAAFLTKSLASKMPASKIMQGIMKLIPQKSLRQFREYLQKGIRQFKGK